mmetsp:Transcript_163347/g.397021  ORF Transcript_163347/g.397021 Transcript_163347/m.397021 type:complete len:345 (-) Transcript_163347:454-1488(-)
MHVLQGIELGVRTCILLLVLVPVALPRRLVVAVLGRGVHVPGPHSQSQHGEVAAEQLHLLQRGGVEVHLEVCPDALHQVRLRVCLVRQGPGLLQQTFCLHGRCQQLVQVFLEEGCKPLEEGVLQRANLLHCHITRPVILNPVEDRVNGNLDHDGCNHLRYLFVVGGVVDHSLVLHRRYQYRAAEAGHEAADGGPVLGGVVHVVCQPSEDEERDGGQDYLTSALIWEDVEAADDDHGHHLSQGHTQQSHDVVHERGAWVVVDQQAKRVGHVCVVGREYAGQHVLVRASRAWDIRVLLGAGQNVAQPEGEGDGQEVPQRPDELSPRRRLPSVDQAILQRDKQRRAA